MVHSIKLAFPRHPIQKRQELYQCAKHRNTASRIAPFNLKCAKHMWIKGSIHYHDYDEDVFPCVQMNQINRVNSRLYISELQVLSV